jgi:putative ABC transport system permease protein
VANPSLVYHNNYWLGGAVIGQSELMELQAALWSGKQVQGVWFVPVKLGGLTPALVAPRSNAITAQAADIYGQEAESAAALLLILLSAGLAADRYQSEFSLLLVRGSSVGQVAFVALARAAAAAGPGIAAGLAAAIVVLPRGSGSVTAWLLPGLVALFVFVGIPARSAWRLRRAVQPADTSRAEIAAPRRSMRRWLAELTIVAAGVAAVVALETRGLAAGQNELALAIPVLVAATVSIALARLYPIPVRMLLPLATRRRGPVGFLGLARAGRSGMSTIVPALALVLTMTLAALGWMLAQSVYAGQVTTSWVQSGADAVVTATLNNTISAADQHRLAAVPGVRRTALAYTSTATSPFAATLLPASDRGYETTGSFTTGLMVIDPGPYAALAGQTPWPEFPASALARRPGPVPDLISAGAAPLDHGRAVTGTRQNLDLGGITIPVVVEGIIGATPAEPAGGNYVVLPAWAAGNFPSIPGMTTFMATGPRLSPAAMTRAARTLVPGGPVVIRSSVLHQLRSAASEYEVHLFIVSIWITVARSLVALGFGLTATTQSRRHLRTRTAALGMSGRQTRALALTDAIPLLVVAVLGMVAAGTALVVISGDVIKLGPLTGATGEVAVTLDWPALAVPGALAIILALAGIAIENWRAARAESAAALRIEEA